MGEYEFKRSGDSFLGQGGFGSVWKGQKIQGNRDVAIKELLLDPGKRSSKLYKREEDILKNVSRHRNIVTFYATKTLDIFMYFILEYCILGDLNRFFKEQVRVSFQSRLHFMKDLVTGLSFLHDNRITHRDLKPGNVLIQDDNDGMGCYAKLSDFGLSRLLPGSSSPLSDVSIKVGTVGWRAPEVPLHPDPDFRYDLPIDIYSLGLVFFAMLKYCPGQILKPLMGMYIYSIFYTNHT